MPSLESRIEALECAAPQREGITIIRRHITPGELNPAIVGLRADDGQTWQRQPGESEQELIDRAAREVQRNAWGVASLTAEP
jgi:hypothetical protein